MNREQRMEATASTAPRIRDEHVAFARAEARPDRR